MGLGDWVGAMLEPRHSKMSCSQMYPPRGITRISSIAAPHPGQSGEAGGRFDGTRSSRIMSDSCPQMPPESPWSSPPEPRCPAAGAAGSAREICRIERPAAERWSEWQDLNLRPPRPERGALPGCATLRYLAEAAYIASRPRRPQARRKLIGPACVAIVRPRV